MRRVVALLLASCLVAACGDDGGRLHTWRSAAYGYAIDRPADWTIVEASGRLEPGSPPFTSEPVTDILAAHADRTAREMELPAVVIGAQPIEPGTPIEEWRAEVIDIVDVMKGCPAPTEVSATAVDGEDAAVLEYPDCPHGSDLDHVWVAVVHDDLAFHIVWFVESEDAEGRRPAFDRMLASIRFSAD